MQCYELLTIKPDDIVRTIATSGPVFAENDYRVALKLITQSQPTPDNDTLQSLLNDVTRIFQRKH